MTWRHLAAEELPTLLDSFGISSWRWECRGDYSAIDATLVERWRAGLGRDPDADQSWIDYIQGLRRRGIRFERVRKLTAPLTEYLRCQLAMTGMNITAGEDIRWLSAQVAAELEAPDYDYYLFDGSRVVILDFDDFGRLAGLHISDDDHAVERHRAWRDVIWRRAVPHMDLQ